MVRNRKDAGARRSEILHVTMKQIEARGIGLLRIADVAAELGVSPALVVYHFATKEALILEAFGWAAQRDLDKLARHVNSSDRAADRLFSALEWYAPTGRAMGWRLWIEGWAAGLHDPALRQVGSELDLAWRSALIAIIQDGVATGEFRTDDPRGAAWRITALADGLAVQEVARGGLVTPAELTAWRAASVTHELDLDPAALAQM